MRWFVIVLVIVLAVIYLGGAISLGGEPVFAKIDSALGTNVFMDMHMLVFSLIYGGGDTVQEEFERTDSKLEDFSERPIGIDNKKKYRDLDKASQY